MANGGTSAGRAAGRAAAGSFRGGGAGTAAGGRVVLFPHAIALLLESPAGPVAKDLLRRSIRIERFAKQACPVDTGRLRASIAHRLEVGGGGLVGIIGTNVEYAAFVELGTYKMHARPYLRPAFVAAGEGIFV